MKYRYLLLLVLLGFTLAFSQQDCPDPIAASRQVPVELEAEGFELTMARGPFLLATSGRYAYLQIQSFSNVFSPWDETLVSMIEKISGSEGLILDLRNSSGDDMELAYKLAGCFVSEKQAGHKSYDHQGRHVRNHIIKPHNKLNAAFDSPIVILTNQRTRNVAEIATLVLSQLHQVTIMGSPTAGSINPGRDGRYHRTVTRVNFENRGVPVDLAVCEGQALFGETLEFLRGIFKPESAMDLQSL